MDYTSTTLPYIILKTRKHTSFYHHPNKIRIIKLLTDNRHNFACNVLFSRSMKPQLSCTYSSKNGLLWLIYKLHFALHIFYLRLGSPLNTNYIISTIYYILIRLIFLRREVYASVATYQDCG